MSGGQVDVTVKRWEQGSRGCAKSRSRRGAAAARTGVETEERGPMQGSLGLQPAGLGEQSDEASEGERAEDAAPASGLGRRAHGGASRRTGSVRVGLASTTSRLGHLPRGGVRGAGRTSPWRCPEAAGHAGVGSGGRVRGAGTGVWPRPGSRYAAGAASGPQKGQEDDGEQGGGRQSKASVAGAARTARRPSVRPSRLGESGFCAGDGSRRSGDRKRSRRFPGVWLGRGERGDGMSPG